jgi:CHAD domain-containing protein
VAALKVGAKSFERCYRERSRSLLELAKTLPNRPSGAEIHDLRVTARRIQVMRRLLPRAVRTPQTSKQFEMSLRSVLKATSQLRDLDTLLETLEPYRKVLPEDVFRRLGNQRSDAAVGAKVASSVLVEVPAPGFEDSEIRGRKLSRRLRKSVRKHGRRASDLLSKVVQDESKITELHALRKEVKKLRYLCELADDIPRDLTVLTKWQEHLGAVHDFDVALDFVRGNAEPKGRAVSMLQRARRAGYHKFLRDWRAGSVAVLGKTKLLAQRTPPAIP